MPFIRTTTNVNLAVDQEKRLRTGTAELVRDILNKDPIRMMTAYEVIYGWGEPAKIFKI